MSADVNATAIVKRIQRTKKYAHLCESVIRRASDQAVARYRTEKEAEKAARRRLHQVYGAYLEEDWVGEVGRALDAVDKDDLAEPRAFCLPLLDLHASTRERVDNLDTLFPRIFSETGTPSHVLDLACGLNPLTVSWMGLPESCRYTAVDLHEGLALVLNRFFERFGLTGEAVCGDVLEWDDFTADVVFLLKVLPCLARQEKDADLATVARIPSRDVVLSYPLKSLSGRDVGMVEHYGNRAREIADCCGRDLIEIEGASELVFVLRKGA